MEGIVSKPEVVTIRHIIMLLFMLLSNLVCLFLPALISARVIAPEDPINLAAHHVKQLSTPSKNFLRKRDAILFPGAPNASNALALNSTNGEMVEAQPFEEEIDIPGQGGRVHFLVCSSFAASQVGCGGSANLVGID